MTNIKYVTQTEYDYWMKKREEEEQRRKEEESAGTIKKGAKKADKKNPKKPEEILKDEGPPPPKKGEEACIPYEEPIPEPEHTILDKTDKIVSLKVSAVSDFSRYEVDTREIFFKPTLMYT